MIVEDVYANEVSQYKLEKVAERLKEEKKKLKSLLPDFLQTEFDKQAYVSGGAIYSLYNDSEPKDYDFFVRTKDYADKVRNFFFGLLPPHKKVELSSGESKIKICYYNNVRIVISKYAISIGKYQIITKYIGEPKTVVNEFDFKHNMFYLENDKIETLSQWDFLESNMIKYNENRARDISGTIIRVHKFVERGMTISNGEMAKMLKSLRNVGFVESENEIIDDATTY